MPTGVGAADHRATTSVEASVPHGCSQHSRVRHVSGALTAPVLKSGSQKERETVSAPRSADDTEAPRPRSRHQSRMLAWSAPPSMPPPGNGSPESCAGSSTSAGLSQLDP